MPGDYFRLSIEAPQALAFDLTALLARLGHAALEERPSPRGVCLLVYATKPRELERVRDAILAEASRLAAAERVHTEISPLDPGWALSWTEYLEPVQLTQRLSTRLGAAPAHAAASGAIYLQPAYAFGFGEHASTRLVARWLEACCLRRPGASVLDVGTGTGVLALVAARSGAASVLGVDTSEDARAAAQYNAEANGLAACCRFEATALQELGGFDLVVANIEAPVLLALAEGIVARLRPGSELALAGFIAEQCDGLVAAYRHFGVELTLSAQEGAEAGNWRLLSARI